MPEIAGATIGALAVICIPLIAWFSRRATPDGRLALRVERLGRIYALMPDSTEKARFETHLTGAIANLNDWLDPEMKKRRKVNQRVAMLVYFLGIAVGFGVINSVDESVKPWVSPLVGATIGVVIAGAAILTARLLEKSARSRTASATRAAEDAATAERIDALRMGVPRLSDLDHR